MCPLALCDGLSFVSSARVRSSLWLADNKMGKVGAVRRATNDPIFTVGKNSVRPIPIATTFYVDTN